ncbi:MAG: 5-(carboxyamino)imidazole ribonucleotide mutase, partial [Schleiferiaceae bacterium]
KNAGILAAQIVGSSDAAVLQRVVDYKEGLKAKVLKGAEEVKAKYTK